MNLKVSACLTREQNSHSSREMKNTFEDTVFATHGMTSLSQKLYAPFWPLDGHLRSKMKTTSFFVQ